MICILQLAALAYGIVVLITGKFALSKNVVVTGGRARLIGAILACWLPISAGVGILLGITLVLNNPGINQNQIMSEMTQYWWVDLAFTATVIGAVVMLLITAKKSEPPHFGQPNVPPNTPPQKIPPRSESGNPFEPPMGS